MHHRLAVAARQQPQGELIMRVAEIRENLAARKTVTEALKQSYRVPVTPQLGQPHSEIEEVEVIDQVSKLRPQEHGSLLRGRMTGIVEGLPEARLLRPADEEIRVLRQKLHRREPGHRHVDGACSVGLQLGEPRVAGRRLQERPDLCRRLRRQADALCGAERRSMPEVVAREMRQLVPNHKGEPYVTVRCGQAAILPWRLPIAE